MAGQLTGAGYRLDGYHPSSNGSRLGTSGYRVIYTNMMGHLRIAGTVQRLNPPLAPTQRVVVLFDRGTMRPIRAVTSNPDGTYAFEGLADKKYVVMALDTPNGLNAAVADHQSAGLA